MKKFSLYWVHYEGKDEYKVYSSLVLPLLMMNKNVDMIFAKNGAYAGDLVWDKSMRASLETRRKNANT